MSYPEEAWRADYFLFPFPNSSLEAERLINLIVYLALFCRLQIILPALFQMSHVGTQCCHRRFAGAEQTFVSASGYAHQCTSYSNILSSPHSITSPSWPSVPAEPFLTYSPLWVGEQLWFLPGKWGIDFSTTLGTYRTARCYTNWW